MEDTFRFLSRFRCGETEYFVLRRDGRPVVVDAAHVNLAIQNGAEPYPEDCTADGKCWIKFDSGEMADLEDQLEWVFDW